MKNKIKKFFSGLTKKKLLMVLGGVFLAAVVAGAIFLPGTLFRGLVPQQQLILLQDLSVTCDAPATAYTGQTVTVTSNALGGTKPYTYTWNALTASPAVSLPGPNTATLDVKFSSAGQHVVKTYVKDNSGDTKWDDCFITVNDPPPLLLDCAVTPNPTKVGTETTLKAVPTGGVPPYKFGWVDKTFLVDPTLVDPNIHTKLTQVVTTIFKKEGSPSNIETGVVDSLGKVATKTCQFTVKPAPPLEADCYANPDPAYTDEEVQWSGSATGGVPPYTYEWIDSTDATVDGVTTKTVKTSYATATQSHGVRFLVTDSVGAQDGYICSVQVDEAPVQMDPLAVSCSTVPSSIESGDTVKWTATATGGDGTYTYDWTGDKIDGKTTKSVEATFTQAPLTDVFRVTVTSSNLSKTVTCPALAYVTPSPLEEDEEDVTQPAEEAETGEASKCPGVNYPTDIDGHWAEEFIKKGYDYCLFKGVGGKFFPDRYATRAEAASMILYAKDYSPKDDCTTASCQTPFVDLDNKDQGAILNPLYFAGLIEGYPDNGFRPNTLITRAEAASLIVRAFFEPFPRECQDPHCGAGWPDNFFLDITETWQGKYIRVLWDLRIMTGSGPNKVEPNRSITRAEMAKMIVLSYEETH